VAVLGMSGANRRKSKRHPYGWREPLAIKWADSHSDTCPTTNWHADAAPTTDRHGDTSPTKNARVWQVLHLA